jgi:hypothetical protein
VLFYKAGFQKVAVGKEVTWRTINTRKVNCCCIKHHYKSLRKYPKQKTVYILKEFWRWRITLGIIGFLDSVHWPVFQRSITFRKLDVSKELCYLEYCTMDRVKNPRYPLKNRCIDAKHFVHLTGSLHISSRQFRCAGGWINFTFRKGSTDKRPELNGDEESRSNVE